MGQKYHTPKQLHLLFKTVAFTSDLHLQYFTSTQVIDTVLVTLFCVQSFVYLFDIDASLLLDFPQPCGCGLIFHRFFFGHVLLRHVVIFHNASTTQDSEFSHIRSQPMVLFVVMVFLNNAESIINNVRDSSYFSSSEAILKSSSNIRNHIQIFRLAFTMLFR